MKYFIDAVITFLLALSTCDIQATIVDRDDVKAFLDNMVVEYGFDNEELSSVFSRIKLSRSVLQAIERPAEILPWYKYRSLFLQPGRIRLGVEFWKKNRTSLQKAEDIYGVPAEILVAIIGVETRYGKNTGKFKVIDSLATLAFDYPKRAAFFRDELVQYLLLTREQGLEPHSIKGSYAGAMGLPQFIASSYRHYAIDFDNDGHVDIWHNPADAIGSIGNYFKEHGWKPGELVVVPARIEGEKYINAVDDNLKPDLPAGELTRYGIYTGSVLSPATKVKLLDLETMNGNEYWLGFDNFYAITRYNHSVLYAMAVYQLAMEIHAKYTGNNDGPP
ncbi:MAG: lytic murein transglycosylase B [Gammaproteobacteria bacterium]